MNYIVVDLEWNQAMSSKSSVFNKLPIHLRGEIIEIGAVKLNDDMSLGEEFTIDVKPVYFKRMHYKVKKLTGFDKERLAKGLAFPDAMEIFRDWCGEDVTFLTWGCDDRGIMEQNIIIHDLSSSTICRREETRTRSLSPARWSTSGSSRPASPMTRWATPTTRPLSARI